MIENPKAKDTRQPTVEAGRLEYQRLIENPKAKDTRQPRSREIRESEIDRKS